MLCKQAHTLQISFDEMSGILRERLRTVNQKPVHAQIAKLQESQAQLLDHCNTMDNACQQLHQELDQMRSRYESGQAENLRLRAEVEHLRKNLQVGEQSDMVRLLILQSMSFKASAGLKQGFKFSAVSCFSCQIH